MAYALRDHPDIFDAKVSPGIAGGGGAYPASFLCHIGYMYRNMPGLVKRVYAIP
jgi:hypothetical protein